MHEFVLGVQPPPGHEEDYDEGKYPTPRWSELIDLLEFEELDQFQLVFVGKGIGSDPKQRYHVDGGSALTTLEQVRKAALRGAPFFGNEDSGQANRLYRLYLQNRDNTVKFYTNLTGWPRPSHIANIYVQTVD